MWNISILSQVDSVLGRRESFGVQQRRPHESLRNNFIIFASSERSNDYNSPLLRPSGVLLSRFMALQRVLISRVDRWHCRFTAHEDSRSSSTWWCRADWSRSSAKSPSPCAVRSVFLNFSSLTRIAFFRVFPSSGSWDVREKKANEDCH